MNTPEVRHLLTLILWNAEGITLTSTDGSSVTAAESIQRNALKLKTALGLDKADAEIEAAKVAEIERKNV